MYKGVFRGEGDGNYDFQGFFWVPAGILRPPGEKKSSPPRKFLNTPLKMHKLMKPHVCSIKVNYIFTNYLKQSRVFYFAFHYKIKN